jgi:hypothetical protein
MRKLFRIAAILGAVSAVPAAAADTPILFIQATIVQGIYARRCPGAHYNQAKANEAIAMMRAAGRLDLKSFGNIFGDLAFITAREEKKGGLARVCALLRDAVRREPNPFLTFDPE